MNFKQLPLCEYLPLPQGMVEAWQVTAEALGQHTLYFCLTFTMWNYYGTYVTLMASPLILLLAYSFINAEVPQYLDRFVVISYPVKIGFLFILGTTLFFFGMAFNYMEAPYYMVNDRIPPFRGYYSEVINDNISK